MTPDLREYLNWGVLAATFGVLFFYTLMSIVLRHHWLLYENQNALFSKIFYLYFLVSGILVIILLSSLAAFLLL